MTRRWPQACVLIAVATGLWVSFRYASVTWYVESDSAEAYVLWAGVGRSGLSFLRDFHYAPDNWLIWPLPAFFVAFGLLGDAPWVGFAVGWAILAGCSGAVYLVLCRVTHPLAAGVAAAVLLLSHRAAIGEAGFLSYPVSHNASMLLGLLSLHGAIVWAETRQPGWLLAAAVMLTAAGLSDPWTEAAFTLPLGCAAGVLMIRREWKAGLGLGAAAALALFLDHTRLLGSLSFLPAAPTGFAAQTGLLDSAAWLAWHLANWFDFVPRWAVPYARLPGAAEVAADLAGLGAGLAATAVLAARQPARSIGYDMLLAVVVSSAAATCGSYFVFALPGALPVGRLFMAVYVLLIMLFAATTGLAWPRFGRRWKAGIAAYASLMPLAGLASAPAAWSQAGLHTPFSDIPAFDKGNSELTGFLEAHGLRYGYGSYWGNEANAVAWTTHRAVVMHPVMFEPLTNRPLPFYTQVSPSWYTADDEPGFPARTYLALTPGFDGCPDMAGCERAAIGAFGPLSARFQLREVTILVWEHRLFGR